jgi:release factor glutamine methyltransferase
MESGASRRPVTIVALALREATARLDAAGVPTADLDAELLLRHVLGWERARLLTSGEVVVSEAAAASYLALVEQRACRRPLQHLTGTQAFWRHEFVVTPDVLIPRPETELLVEATLERLGARREPTIIDVGTGSGCIALSLALERPDASVWALDVSAAALEVAGENARRLSVADRVRFVRSDLLEEAFGLTGHVDVVVSNPPYVDPADIATLMPEVRDHEPRGALHASEGRQALYARLARQAVQVLMPTGFVVLEIGRGMEAEARNTLAEAGLVVESVLPDLQGIARVVVARPPSA